MKPNGGHHAADDGLPDLAMQSAMDSLREAARAAAPGQEYVLHLYTAGTNARSVQAVERIKRLLEEHLAGRYRLRVTDIYQDPELAEAGQVIAAPTLVREIPEPLRRLVGDMADEGRVLFALGVRSTE